jgi:hypothetical protein
VVDDLLLQDRITPGFPALMHREMYSESQETPAAVRLLRPYSMRNVKKLPVSSLLNREIRSLAGPDWAGAVELPQPCSRFGSCEQSVVHTRLPAAPLLRPARTNLPSTRWKCHRGPR